MREVLSGGFVNKVIGDERFVTKKYEGEEMVGRSRWERYQRERLALSRFARDCRVPVPAIVCADSGNMHLTMSRMSGEIMDETLRICDIQKRLEILRSGGEVLRAIHSPVNAAINNFREKVESAFEFRLGKVEESLGLVGLKPGELHRKVNGLIDWSIVERAGLCRVHRDYWFNNLLFEDTEVSGVIDWEFAGIGSPYEDFAVVDLWTVREYCDGESFWEGYGQLPDQKTIEGFLAMRCVEFLATGEYASVQQEVCNKDGFYFNKLVTIRELLEK